MLIVLGSCVLALLALGISLAVHEVRQTLPARESLAMRRVLLATPIIVLKQPGRGGESWLRVRFTDGDHTGTAGIRRPNFLGDVADVQALQALPAGTAMTLRTSEWQRALFRGPDESLEVWELIASGKTLLSFEQTSEAWQRSRQRVAWTFSLLFIGMLATAFVVWRCRDRLERRSAWDSL